MSDYYTKEAEYFRQKIEFEKAFEDTYGVTFDRIRELAEAEKDGRAVIIGKAFAYPDGRFMTLYYKGGMLMGQVSDTAEESEAEAERALSSANESVDRCSTCENNGKSICSSCIMTGHGNDIDFYKAATEPKGEATT